VKDDIFINGCIVGNEDCYISGVVNVNKCCHHSDTVQTCSSSFSTFLPPRYGPLDLGLTVMVFQ